MASGQPHRRAGRLHYGLVAYGSKPSAPAANPADPHIAQESRDVDPEIIVKPNTPDYPRLFRSVTGIDRMIS